MFAHHMISAYRHTASPTRAVQPFGARALLPAPWLRPGPASRTGPYAPKASAKHRTDAPFTPDSGFTPYSYTYSKNNIKCTETLPAKHCLHIVHAASTPHPSLAESPLTQRAPALHTHTRVSLITTLRRIQKYRPERRDPPVAVHQPYTGYTPYSTHLVRKPR